MDRHWRIRVDRERCIGSAMCLATAPGYFELDDLRLSRPKNTVVVASETVRAAADLCPMEAIILGETAGTAQESAHRFGAAGGELPTSSGGEEPRKTKTSS